MNLSERQDGFTLFEVLVALAVIALSLAGVMKVAGSSVATATHVEESTIAHWVAMNQLNYHQARMEFSKRGEKGKTLMAGHEWTWKTTHKEEEIKFGKQVIDKLNVVTVDVYFDPDDEAPRASLVTAFPTDKQAR